MIENITRDNYREFSSRYQNTFGILVSASGKRILVSIEDISAHAVGVRDINEVGYTLNSDTGCELEFTQVPSQWFKVDNNHIVYITRKPERQWKRGICSENTSILHPYKRKGSSICGLDSINQFTMEQLAQVLTPQENLDAFEGFHTDPKCGLWSKYFAYFDTSIWVKDLYIGSVDHEKRSINLNNNNFKQELKDALTRSNSEYVIE